MVKISNKYTLCISEKPSEEHVLFPLFPSFLTTQHPEHRRKELHWVQHKQFFLRNQAASLGVTFQLDVIWNSSGNESLNAGHVTVGLHTGPWFCWKMSLFR